MAIRCQYAPTIASDFDKGSSLPARDRHEARGALRALFCRMMRNADDKRYVVIASTRTA